MAPITSPEPSLYHIERVSQYVPLPPAALTSPLPAVCAEIFSPLLLTYYAPVRGILLAYEDVKLSSSAPVSANPTSQRKRRRREQPAAEHQQEDDEDSGGVVLLRQIDEYASPFLWATASLLVFTPRANQCLTATLTHQSATHITLSHLNTFPITVLKVGLPSSWTYVAEHAGRKRKGWDGRIADGGGWWVDGDGQRVDEGREVMVRITEWEARGGLGKGRGFVRIEGCLVEKEGKGKERVGEEEEAVDVESDSD